MFVLPVPDNLMEKWHPLNWEGAESDPSMRHICFMETRLFEMFSLEKDGIYILQTDKREVLMEEGLITQGNLNITCSV